MTIRFSERRASLLSHPGEGSSESYTEDQKFPKFKGSDPGKKECLAWVGLKRHCSCDAQEVDAAEDVLFHVFWG